MVDKDAQKNLEWMKRELDRYEAQLSKAMATVDKVQPIVGAFRSVIKVLETLETQYQDSLSRELPPDESTPETESDAEVVAQNGLYAPPVSPFAPGVKKSDRMPDRHEKYRLISILEAARQILEDSSEPLHADQIVSIIYDVQTKEQFKAAKQSLVSEMLRGAEKGMWPKRGGNYYG